MAEPKNPKPGWADDPPPVVVKNADGSETDVGRALAERNAKNDKLLAKARAERAT